MRLRILDIQASHASESDFDTAVDMLHWSMICRTLLLESPGGVRFQVQAEEEWTTYTYIEPDFDHLERTGQTVWETHHDPTRDVPATVRLSFDGLYVAQPAEPVSVDELQMAERKHGNDPWAIDGDVDLPHELRVRLNAHLQGGDGRPTIAGVHNSCVELVTPHRVGARMEDDEIQRLSELEGRRGQVVVVELPPDFEGSILAAEKLHAAIVAANDPIVSDNDARAAQARLGILIDELADKARQELKRLFDSRQESVRSTSCFATTT